MRDLNEVLDLQLRLPIGGKTYTVNPPTAATGAILINRLAAGIAVDAGVELDDDTRGMVAVPDEDVPDFARQCLGTTYDQMVDDGLSKPQLEFAVTTAFLAWTVGREYAELWWDSGGKAGRPAGARDLHPTVTRTRTAAATTTQSTRSRSGTKPRKALQDRKGTRSPRSGPGTGT